MTGTPPDSLAGTEKVLVLITGTGRSGTSTMSGTLHHLGLHVPGPYLGSNDSNPKGFFESRWAVRFHKALIDLAEIHEFDSRPAALERVRAVITPEHRRQLHEFLSEQAAVGDQIVVKDPRTVWVQELWREVAVENGLSVRYISMLRHPAEVVGSRTTYYSRDAGSESEAAAEERRRYAVFNVARWVNGSLVNERETRGHPRAFVQYTDLLQDWRPVLERIRADLGLRYDVTSAPSAVDDFIDPALRRHAMTWDDLEIPRDLRDVAQAVWEELDVLADRHGADEAASHRLDALARDYAQVVLDAAAVDHDARAEAIVQARRRGAAEALGPEAGRPGSSSVLDRASLLELVRALCRRGWAALRRRTP